MNSYDTAYEYTVVREYWDGSRGKRNQKWLEFRPRYDVGGLYVHNGKMYRILSMDLQVLY